MNLQDRTQGLIGGVSTREKDRGNEASNHVSPPSAINFCGPILGKQDEIINSQKEVIATITQHYKDLSSQLTALSKRIDTQQKDDRLDSLFPNVLIFLQNLDSYLFDVLIDDGFRIRVREDLLDVLNLYGYRIVNYDTHPSCYDEIRYDGDDSSEIEISCRAIVNQQGQSILRGRVYIPVCKNL